MVPDRNSADFLVVLPCVVGNSGHFICAAVIRRGIRDDNAGFRAFRPGKRQGAGFCHRIFAAGAYFNDGRLSGREMVFVN